MSGGMGGAIGGFAGLVGTVLGAPVTVPVAGAAAGLYAGVAFGQWMFVGLMCYLFFLFYINSSSDKYIIDILIITGVQASGVITDGLCLSYVTLEF